MEETTIVNMDETQHKITHIDCVFKTRVQPTLMSIHTEIHVGENIVHASGDIAGITQGGGSQSSETHQLVPAGGSATRNGTVSDTQ